MINKTHEEGWFLMQTRWMLYLEDGDRLRLLPGIPRRWLAAGLLWALVHPDPQVGRQIAVFFAGCVSVAGVYGGVTANRKIFFVQAVPGVVTLGAVVWAWA